MPRKVNYGLDYDDDHEEYDFDVEMEECGEEPESDKKQETNKEIWRCFICSYDNEEGMNVCDICGVVRHSLIINTAASDNNKTGTRSSYVSSIFPQNNELKVLSNGESLYCSPSLVKKVSQDSFAESKLSKDVALKTSGRLPASSAKGESKMGKIKSCNEAKIDIQFSEELSDSLSALLKVRDSDGEIHCCSNKDVRPQSSSENMVVDVRTGKSENTISKGPHPQMTYKPEKWMLNQHAEDTLTQLNLAVVGHVDSGKSTLSGRLLHLSGRITKKEMHKYEKEAKLQVISV